MYIHFFTCVYIFVCIYIYIYINIYVYVCICNICIFLYVSDRCRPFPTVFIFSEWLIIGPIPFMEGWSSANPCKPWRLSFFVRPLCAYTAPNIASWPWYPILPKSHKIPGAREIQYICIYTNIYIYIFVYIQIYWISRAPGILWLLGSIGYQGHDAIFGAVYAHKGRTKKLKRHGLHGFALDQPSINGIGPIINHSEKMKTVGNGRQRSETYKNMHILHIHTYTYILIYMYIYMHTNMYTHVKKCIYTCLRLCM